MCSVSANHSCRASPSRTQICGKRPAPPRPVTSAKCENAASPAASTVTAPREPRPMEIIASPIDMQRWSENARHRGATIAFVPTMGFLHEGHLTLMREGRRRARLLASSLFVNPTQFGPNEDFSRYPRNFERDCELMRSVPVDVLFAPEPDVMYPAGSQTWVEATDITQGLCGAHRPGHFRGVTTVVAKLFNVVKPHVALFGEKDFQQLRTIQRMVTDLNFD